MINLNKKAISDDIGYCPPSHSGESRNPGLKNPWMPDQVRHDDQKEFVFRQNLILSVIVLICIFSILFFGFWVPDLSAMWWFKDSPPPQSQAQKSVAPLPESIQITLPVCTVLKVQLNQSIRTSTHRSGQSFFATLKEPLMLGEKTILPGGIPFIGTISKIVESGHFSGTALIELQLIKVILTDQSTYPLNTKPFQKVGRSHLVRNIGMIGAGAILGAGVGTLLGKIPGAITGIGLGGGIGTVLAYVTGKEDLFLKAGTEVVFVLSGPLKVSLASLQPSTLK